GATIVGGAAQVIAAPAREPLAGLAERIAIHAAPTDRAEAESVVKAIEDMIGGHSFFSIDSGRSGAGRSDRSFADFAVLYRTEAQSALIVEALARSGIPYQKRSHAPLADEPAVRGRLAALTAPAIAAGSDALRATAQRLKQRGEDAAAVDGALQRLSALAASCGNDGILDAAALATDADFFDPRADRVSLLTLHAAKGLEFPVVFIVGLEDGILPLHWGAGGEAATAEERRLFYVGMTRARERLILSRAEQRHWRGRLRRLPPSPFLSDIEQRLVEHERSTLGRRRRDDRQLRLL